jgi:hypothetical protein
LGLLGGWFTVKWNVRRTFWLILLGLLGVFCVGKLIVFASLGMLCFNNGFVLITATGSIAFFVLGLVDLVTNFAMFGVVLGLLRKVGKC